MSVSPFSANCPSRIVPLAIGTSLSFNTFGNMRVRILNGGFSNINFSISAVATSASATDTAILPGNAEVFSIGPNAILNLFSAGASTAYVSIEDGTITGNTLSPYLGQVATKTSLANFRDITNTQFMSRSPHFSRTAISSLQVVLPNWCWQSNIVPTGETNSGGSASYTASVEYPAGVFTQILFSGIATGSAADGNNLVSDVCTVAIPNGALFWIRYWCSASVAAVYNAGRVSGSTNVSYNDVGNGQGFTFGASVADQTLGGTVVNTGVSAPIQSAAPLAIIATTRSPAIFLMGDSINWGFGDAFDATGNIGETARSIGGSLAYINVGCFGDTSANASIAYAKRSTLFQYCSHVVCNYGINGIAGGNTAAQEESFLANLYAFAGKRPVYQNTITPFASSSDQFRTIPLQTTNGTNPQRVALNNLIRANTNINGFFETDGAVEDTLNLGKWKVNGVAFGYTIDGIHPSLTGYLTIANSGAINPLVFSS